MLGRDCKCAVSSEHGQFAYAKYTYTSLQILFFLISGDVETRTNDMTMWPNFLSIMTCCQMGAFNCPSLDCAPCPPFFVVDIYQILVNVSLSQNLTEHEYKSIAERCNIQEPTTTTTTTTTTTPSTTLMISTTTTTRTTTTTSTSAATVTSYITDTISDNITSPVDSENSTYIPKSTTVSYSTQEKTPTTSALNTSSSLSPDITAVTGGRTTPGRTDLSTGGSTSKRRWPYCNDVCLIVVITSSVCAFLIVLVALAL